MNPEPVTSIESPNQEPMRVLVVDDEIYNRLVLEAILTTDGHTVLFAENGREAVDLFREEDVDLVLMDITMPEMDGYEATRQIKALTGDDFVPVIFLTASTDEDSLASCVSSGGDDFLTKPFSQVILAAKIQAQSRIRALYRTVKNQHDALQAHQLHEEQDQEVANNIFSRIVHLGCLDELGIPYLTSSMALFNGDMLLAARTPSGALRVMLGDFTGHGLSAAVGAIPTAEVFYGMTAKGYHLSEVVAEVNKKLNHILPTGFFCAACLAEIDYRQRLLSMWLGGLPDVMVYSGKTRRIKRTVVSQRLPLGILDSKRMDHNVESVELDEDDRLLIYSDGVVETMNADGEAYGFDRLQEVIQAKPDGDWVLPRLLDEVARFRGSAGQADDMTLIELPCDLHERLADTAADQDLAAAKAGTHWTASLHLDADALRHSDPVPTLLHLINEVQALQQYRGDLFTVLSELFNNARDHGVLGLQSSMKNSPEGFLAYYEEQARRLGELREGGVDFHLRHVADGSGGRLTIRVEDTGAGFDYRESPTDMNDNVSSSGRGIPLLQSLCESLRYEGKGNIVEVVYRWQ